MRVSARHLIVLAPALAAGLALSTVRPVAAQGLLLDEGTFRITVAGRELGTETFAIRRAGGESGTVVATGRVALARSRGGEQLTVSLEAAGAGLRPAAYQIVVDGAEQQRIAGEIAGGRFRAKILSPVGEQMREYLASDGAFLLDDGVAHHYYFLARRIHASASDVAIIIPRQNRQVTATVEVLPPSATEVAGRSIEAARLRVRPAGGDERTVWIDEQGRVLRVEIPARDYVAVRTALP